MYNSACRYCDQGPLRHPIRLPVQVGAILRRTPAEMPRHNTARSAAATTHQAWQPTEEDVEVSGQALPWAPVCTG